MKPVRHEILEGPVIRTMFSLGLPTFVTQLSMGMYHIMDTYFLSKYDAIAVAIPREIWPILMLFTALGYGLSAVCLSTTSQLVARKEYKKVEKSFSRLFSLSLLLGILMSILLFVFAKVILDLLVHVPHELHEEVILHARVATVEVFLTHVIIILSAAFQGLGNPLTSAMINIFSVSINIVLDPVLIFGFGPLAGIGPLGAAITNVIGKTLDAILLFYMLRKFYKWLKLKLDWHFPLKWLKRISATAQPIFFIGFMNSLSFITQLNLINSLGPTVVVAYSIGCAMLDLIDFFLLGLMGGASIMIGYCLGVHKIERARKIGLKAALLGFVMMGVFTVSLSILIDDVIFLFTDIPQIYYETKLFLSLVMPSIPFLSLIVTGVSVGRGSGHTFVPSIIVIIRLWAVRVALGYVLAFWLGLNSIGLWTAISLSNFMGILSLMWIWRGQWTHGVPFTVEAVEDIDVIMTGIDV